MTKRFENERKLILFALMNVPGLTTRKQLLEGAIDDFDSWRQSSEAAGIPAHRLENIREKLNALRRSGTVNLLRTGIEHVSASLALADVPIAVFSVTFEQLRTLAEERKAPDSLTIKTCDECVRHYYAEISSMAQLCPECSHLLYGYKPCKPTFVAGRCSRCYWDGSPSGR